MDTGSASASFAAGLPAGAMNAAAGGGSFVTIPAMVAVGLPSVAANASSTVALLSDRGRQYVSILYTERLVEAGIEPSVGSVGDSYDNALAETVIGLFKTEVIRRRGPWRNVDAVEYATLEWVDRHNNRRLPEPIGDMPPAEAEARHYAQQEEPAPAA